MTEQEKCVWGWIGAGLVVMAICVMGYLFSLDDSSEWSAAKNANTAKAYREFYVRHRTSKFADDALSRWEASLRQLREGLDLMDFQSVGAFLKDYPEFDDEEVREAQYQAVVADGSYETFQRYCHAPSTDDVRREKVAALIDEMVMAEVREAKGYDDFLRLSRRYSNWRGCRENILPHVERLKLEAGSRAWELVKESRDEDELRKFMQNFEGTAYVRQAEERIDSLWGDLDYVKEKSGSLEGYMWFVKNHPDSPRVREAQGLIEAELEAYVFRRKEMKGDESRVRSALSDYALERPLSGVVACEPRYQTVSPLKITTDYGSGDYYVKLVETRTRQVVGIYVRGSSTIEVEVPDGTYAVRYATGSTWHGTRLLFGFDAHYSRANELFTFSHGSGYSLTLRKVVDGNLRTETISPQEF